MTEILSALEAYVPLFQTLAWVFLLIIVVAVLRNHLNGFIGAFVERIRAGSPIKFDKEGFELGEQKLVKNTADAKEKEEVKVFGNPDWFKLLFKAQGETWIKSTKAMEVADGCVIQITTERKNLDGSWSNAEALTFVPGVVIVEDEEGEGRHLGSSENE